MANYIAVFLSLCVAWMILRSTVNTVRRQGLLVMMDPFLLPFLATLFPYAVFLALSAAVSLAREREGRTMEVLFYAPVDHWSFVLARFLGQLSYYFIALPFLAMFFLGYAREMNLRVSPGLLGAMALSPFTVAGVVGFGLILASCLGRVRATIIVLLGVTLVLLAVQVGYAVLPTLQTGETSSPLLLLREGVTLAYRVVEWVSPFVLLAKGVEAARIGAIRLYGLVFLSSIVYTCVALALSTVILRKRGVRR